ncbi:MAG: two-component sensor histidine kinase, partial [Proteobacteria bacterium]
MIEDSRRSPDALLQEIYEADQKNKRGRLRVFFGMCPGVGKTYAMLKAAQQKRLVGHPVVVGIVETHGRQETEALLMGLEFTPRKKITINDHDYSELDLESLLKSRPSLVLVDELAHSNAPGSRHPKRYQDVQELLDSGIDVYTTLNVQHVESRADLVYQISGVPVRETVPDLFLEQANPIDLIDLNPEELLIRLHEGKVYLGERVHRAAENFFKVEKLTALRELALRFTAELVDQSLLGQMQEKRISGPWNTSERLLVAVSHSPSSARLIRSTRRTAALLEAPWIALYVESGAKLETDDHEMLTKNINLARELGAEVITTRDQSVSQALRRIASDRNVTQIVMGRPDRRFLSDLFKGGTILDQLVLETSEIDIHIIRQKRKPVHRGFHFRLPEWISPFRAYLKTFVYLSMASIISYGLQVYLGYRAAGFLLLLALLPVASL